MRIIYTLENLDNLSNAIFLAGGTIRQPNNKGLVSWRKDAIFLLEISGYEGDIIIPEWAGDVKPDGWTYSKQVEWELEGLYKASKILFYIPRDMENLPCMTTNVEFGNFIDSEKIWAGGNDVKNDYIKYRLQRNNKKWFDDLESMIEDIVDYDENKEPTYWFTADTHFSQKRTLELSKRPFKNVLDMDLTLISNWNSVISNKDMVFHLGDFGNPDIVKSLNGAVIFLLEGNYEKNDSIKFDDKRVKVCTSLSEIIDIDEEETYTYEISHEPMNNNCDKDIFGLYGHVHALQKVKRNMLNVGVDSHNFFPISLSEVEFFKKAIQNFYDEDVFCEGK